MWWKKCIKSYFLILQLSCGCSHVMKSNYNKRTSWKTFKYCIHILYHHCTAYTNIDTTIFIVNAWSWRRFLKFFHVNVYETKGILSTDPLSATCESYQNLKFSYEIKKYGRIWVRLVFECSINHPPNASVFEEDWDKIHNSCENIIQFKCIPTKTWNFR